MTVGDRIKKLREERQLTQEELAKFINSTKQTIYKYENNIVTNIPSDKIEGIAKALNITPSELMGWDDTELERNRKVIQGYRNRTTMHTSTNECIVKYENEIITNIENILNIIFTELTDVKIKSFSEAIAMVVISNIFENILIKIFNDIKVEIYKNITRSWVSKRKHNLIHFDSNIVINNIKDSSDYINNIIKTIINNSLKNDILTAIKDFFPNKKINEQSIENLIDDNFLNNITSDISVNVKKELYEDVRLEIIIDNYYILNETGQEKVSEYIEDLTENNKYRKEDRYIF